MGLIFAPAQNAATSGVQHRDAGVASAMINTMQPRSPGQSRFELAVGWARGFGPHALTGKMTL
jgi:hypothetical protein